MSSVEGGGIGGAGIAVASAGGVAAVGAPSFEAGPASFISVASFSPIVNEGPLGFVNFADFKPIDSLSAFVNEGLPSPAILADMYTIVDNVNLRGSERFDVGIGQPLNPADAVLEAESILAQARIRPLTKEGVVAEAEHRLGAEPIVQMYGRGDASVQVESAALPKTEPVYAPFLESAPRLITKLDAAVQHSVTIPQVETKTQAEARVFSQPTQEVATSTHEQEIEELVEQEVVAANNDQSQLKDEQGELVQQLKVQRIVDKSVIQQRVKEIVEAATKAKSESDLIGSEKEGKEDEIEGKDIIKHLPSQHKGNRSGELNIVDPQGKLLDGTWLLMVKKIAKAKFTTLKEVMVKAPKIVEEDVPVTQGEGQPVKDEDMAKVYKQQKGKVPPAQEVFRRVIRMVKRIKIVQNPHQPAEIVPLDEKVTQTTEGTIQDHIKLAQALQAA